MKSAVETLGPTRVRLSVEVPFDELQPAIDGAYRTLAQQVRVRGFRPGKVPPRIIDQQVGRAAVLSEAIDQALPRFYGEAVRSSEVSVLGHPELEITQFADGSELHFTAEVDVRPEIELPDYEGLPVTVDDVEVTEADVAEQIDALRDRFAVLTGVERPVQTGDYVMIDLASTLDGEPVEDASATGLSYEVGSDRLVPGLDDALLGAAEGDERSFPTTLRGGELAGREVTMSVTVRSVKAKELPELDDDFAQTASEFDTLEELQADVRRRVERVKRLQQGLSARDRVLEVYLERVEVPMPEHVLSDEVAWRLRSMDEQLAQVGLTREAYAAAEEREWSAIEAEVRDNAAQALRAQFVLDALAMREQLQVSEADLTEQIVARAQRNGVAPQQLANEIVESGQLPALAGEVLRAKALAVLLEHAAITDASGRPVNLAELAPEIGADDELDADELDADEADSEGAGADGEVDAEALPAAE